MTMMEYLTNGNLSKCSILTPPRALKDGRKITIVRGEKSPLCVHKYALTC